MTIPPFSEDRVPGSTRDDDTSLPSCDAVPGPSKKKRRKAAGPELQLGEGSEAMLLHDRRLHAEYEDQLLFEQQEEEEQPDMMVVDDGGGEGRSPAAAGDVLLSGSGGSKGARSSDPLSAGQGGSGIEIERWALELRNNGCLWHCDACMPSQFAVTTVARWLLYAPRFPIGGFSPFSTVPNPPSLTPSS